MNNRPVSFFSTLILTSFISMTMIASVSFAASNDAAKLKILENAVTATPNNRGKMPRTRSIVFDNDPQTEATTPANSQESGMQTTAPPEMNCSALPSNVATTAVDFAIQFKVNSAAIAPTSEKILGLIAQIIAMSPNKCIQVEGHTDTTGNTNRNMSLSRDRADSVVRFMIKKTGMERSRFVPAGKGSSDLLKDIAPTDPANRRVVFKIVD